MVEMVLEAAPATAPQPSPRTRGGCQKDLPTDSTAPFETFHGRGVRGADRSPQSSGTREVVLRADPRPRNYSRFEVSKPYFDSGTGRRGEAAITSPGPGVVNWLIELCSPSLLPSLSTEVTL